MVELFPSMPPILLHVSEMDNARVSYMTNNLLLRILEDDGSKFVSETFKV